MVTSHTELLLKIAQNVESETTGQERVKEMNDSFKSQLQEDLISSQHINEKDFFFGIMHSKFWKPGHSRSVSRRN